jgi:hypothetical protein
MTDSHEATEQRRAVLTISTMTEAAESDIGAFLDRLRIDYPIATKGLLRAISAMLVYLAVPPAHQLSWDDWQEFLQKYGKLKNIGHEEGRAIEIATRGFIVSRESRSTN